MGSASWLQVGNAVPVGGRHRFRYLLDTWGSRTIDSWRDELLAYFDTAGVSNGPTEAINGLIKKVKRVGHGFRNFNNYRLRLLLHCGVQRQTPPTTPIRERLPRLAA